MWYVVSWTVLSWAMFVPHWLSSFFFCLGSSIFLLLLGIGHCVNCHLAQLLALCCLGLTSCESSYMIAFLLFPTVPNWKSILSADNVLCGGTALCVGRSVCICLLLPFCVFFGVVWLVSGHISHMLICFLIVCFCFGCDSELKLLVFLLWLALPVVNISLSPWTECFLFCFSCSSSSWTLATLTTFSGTLDGSPEFFLFFLFCMFHLGIFSCLPYRCVWNSVPCSSSCWRWAFQSTLCAISSCLVRFICCDCVLVCVLLLMCLISLLFSGLSWAPCKCCCCFVFMFYNSLEEGYAAVWFIFVSAKFVLACVCACLFVDCAELANVPVCIFIDFCVSQLVAGKGFVVSELI